MRGREPGAQGGAFFRHEPICYYNKCLLALHSGHGVTTFSNADSKVGDAFGVFILARAAFNAAGSLWPSTTAPYRLLIVVTSSWLLFFKVFIVGLSVSDQLKKNKKKRKKIKANM